MIEQLYATKTEAFEAGKLVGLHIRTEQSRERVKKAAERVAQKWDNHGKGEYFADIYEAVEAELSARG